MKHTPGPWKVNAGEESDYTKKWNRIYITMPPEDEWFWEDCYIDKKQAMADATLIAAAPELLEMVEEVAQEIDNIYLRKKMEKLIAKAKGEIES